MAVTIDGYSFGSIIIDGRAYGSDLIIYPDRVDDQWWRRDGHLLQTEDLAGVFAMKPAVLIVGQGLPGLMKVAAQVVDRCRDDGTELIILPTAQAAQKYNQTKEKGPLVIAALHLTC